jgi:glycosyltransferase involved in cell wall biosynthesis
VIVSGGFHRSGGMDQANAALAEYLGKCGVPTHLVAYDFDPEFDVQRAATIYRVCKPAGSFFLGERRLDRLGRAVARTVLERRPEARVVVNGSNCAWPDINWVHFVHHAWRPAAAGAPVWIRAKIAAEASLSRRREARTLRRARTVIANSERTRNDLIELGVAAERIHTVYLGNDAEWKTVTPERRAAARNWLGLGQTRPIVAFVGAFSHDSRKGFDTLWRAWRRLCLRPEWDADLVVAGGGRGLMRWQREIERAGREARVRILGFTDRVTDVLAAADLLVSPARYESYGLNVQEALSCGVPAIVSASAGVAERYPADLAGLLLPDANDADDLCERMIAWRREMESFKRRVEPIARMLRGYTWEDCARRFVDIVQHDSERVRVARAG